ncbi:hypothetical protein [Azohydromonas aeria]|uniref:hypothetical protein n=1 Tax=Azohydromonas aeria TaxID=2590212 RepID=UPI0012FB7904|nr:hypothetical protein [Azohydromonas aeria]
MTPFSSEDLPSPAPVRAVGTVLAGCRIEAVLHAGPVCTVYQAGDAVGAARLALKEYAPAALCVRDADGTPRLRDPDDAAARAAFETGRAACLEELRLLSRLRLPGLVTVLQASETEGSLCGVMPLLPGVTLDRLPPARSDDEVRELLLALLEPLAQLHAAGLVHGGLHARQLVWAPGQRPVLLGFQSAARALRQADAFLDAAPEVRPEGAHLPRGPWTDLHALACTVLRHTTSGAWDGSTTTAADVALALERALPAPGGRTRQRLVQALQACLRPSPTERPAGAVALRALLGDAPTAAPSVQPPHPALRRTEAAAGSAAAGLGPAAGAPARPGAGRAAQAPPSSAAAGMPASGQDPALAERPGAADETAAPRAPPAPVGARDVGRDPFPAEAPDRLPALSRPRAGLRAALLGLPLLALLGYGAWWLQERWQAGQEQERVGRLLAQAASPASAPAPVPPRQLPMPPVEVLPDPQAPRVARPEAPAPGGLAGARPPATLLGAGAGAGAGTGTGTGTAEVGPDGAAPAVAPPSVTGLGAATPSAAPEAPATPPARQPKAASRSDAPPPPAAAAAPATPLAACVAQPKSVLERCMRQQCARPAWRGHVQCERWLE